MRVGEVLSSSWALYSTHWRHFLAVTLSFYVILIAFAVFIVFVLGMIGALVVVFVAIAANFWLQGSLVTAVEDVLDGRPDLTVRETFSHVRPHINRLSVAALIAASGVVVAASAIFFGLLLFVVPGLALLILALFLITRWSLWIPLIMLENEGLIRALGRSNELVRGSTWSVFGIIALTIGALTVSSTVSQRLPPFAGGLLNLATGILTAQFVALTWTLMYYRLRRAREGVAEPAFAPTEPAP